MKYSIVVPTYNHLEDCLKPCLESIKQYTDLNSDDIEIIVVANGCKDDTRKYVEDIGSPFKLSWIEEPSGYTISTNEGIKIASGEYIVLLNNDTILNKQEKNNWLNILEEPFIKDEKVGLTGPLQLYSEPADSIFLVFFCVMIKRKLFDEIGLLNKEYSPGAGEDTEFAIEAMKRGYRIVQVPSSEQLKSSNGLMIGGFPIYHKGEATVSEIPEWKEIFERNSNILRLKYNKKYSLHNNFERAVIGFNDPVPPRENTRYSWAVNNCTGNKILEIGCSSGYGLKYFKDILNLDYTGIDKDQKIIEYAKEQFGNYGKFESIGIDDFVFGENYWDTIICFECIEHLENGIEWAQKLKNYCNTLLLTVPYKEPVGFWGPHHKLHNLSEKDFPNFEYRFVNSNGLLNSYPYKEDPINLMLIKWEKGKDYEKIVVEEKEEIIIPKIESKPKITVEISTKDRYHTTLPLTIESMLNQSYLPYEILIFDDGECKDLRNDSVYSYIFKHIDLKKIQWKVIFGKKAGQVLNHQEAIKASSGDWIFRIDDDCIAEYDVLEKLVNNIDDKIGAVGCLVLDPKNTGILPENITYNKIEHVFNTPNIQWFIHNDKTIKEVDHLYSSFLYRKEAAKHGYCQFLSEVGHREETIFTYEMKRQGYKLLVDPNAIIWHYRNPEGGIRNKNVELFEADEKIFIEKMKSWNFNLDKKKIIVLNSGLGDHIAFSMILPKLLEKYPDMIISCCFPEVFEDFPCPLISIAQSMQIMNINMDELNKRHNIYGFMWSKNWKKSISEAYYELYK